MRHIFKKTDNTWIYSGTKIPSNLETDDYIEGKLPEGEKWDYEYEYTCIDGVATKGNRIVYIEPELITNEVQYPTITEQLDMLYTDIDNGKFGDAAKTSQFYLTLKTAKESNPGD